MRKCSPPFTTVDEDHFYDALSACQCAASGVPAASASQPPDASTFQPMALRGCCAMLLGIGSRLHGKAHVAANYFDEARSLVSLSTMREPPSQLLVSSLLLLTLVSSSGMTVDGEASRHAALAHGLCPLVPGIRPEIRLAVNVVRYNHTSAARGAGWPPIHASPGTLSLKPTTMLWNRRGAGCCNMHPPAQMLTPCRVL